MRNISATLCALVAATGVSLASRSTHAYAGASGGRPEFREVATYTVQKGDTLWGIARYLTNGGYQCIMQENKITDPKKLREGQVLYLESCSVRRIVGSVTGNSPITYVSVPNR